VSAADPGAYLVRIAQTFESADGTDAASRTLGVVSPAAEEYRRLGVDSKALAAFAAAGGGRELALATDEAREAVWTHDISAAAFPTPIWPWLLLMAIVLVPLDVGVRRVALSRADARRARAWMARRVGLGRAEPEAMPGLAELRTARERSARRTERHVPEGSDSSPGAAMAAAAPEARAGAAERRPRPASAPRAAPEPPAATPATEAPNAEETLAERLARRRRGS
jgi:hypothetical protein